MGAASDTILARAVESAMRDIVSAAHRPEGSYVRTPLFYPNGTTVVVRVSGGPGHNNTDGNYFVTDFGLGFTEAEMMGFERTYVRQARAVALAAGVGFDEHAFFAVEVPQDRISGAIATVANCSAEAVAVTAFKASERAHADAAEYLIEKLEKTFGIARVTKNGKVLGASNHEWEMTATVADGRRQSVFEVATKHANSIASVATKMNDIARLEHAPRRIVMVHNKADFGTYLNVLGQTASVVEDTIEPEQIRKLAEAA
jgi:hypothetical protein